MELGGWAEWALTEDLELAMRILSKGYNGYVFADTWGKGLIPETVEGLKRQQFRWWAGASQEFRVNWRCYCGLDNNPLTVAQRVFRWHRTLNSAFAVSMAIFDVVLVLLCIHVIANDKVMLIPGGVIAIIAAIFLVRGMKILVGVKEVGGRKFNDYIFTLMVKGALNWVSVTAFVLPMLNVRLSWIRTDKFKQFGSLARAASSSVIETSIALLYFFSAALIYRYADFRRIDILALIFIWLLIRGGAFTCTLIMAFISESELIRLRNLKV